MPLKPNKRSKPARVVNTKRKSTNPKQNGVPSTGEAARVFKTLDQSVIEALSDLKAGRIIALDDLTDLDSVVEKNLRKELERKTQALRAIQKCKNRHTCMQCRDIASKALKKDARR